MPIARPKFIQSKVTTLLAPVTDSEVLEILLTSLVDLYGNQLTMSDFWTTGYLTFEPGTSNEEIVSFSNFTVNDDASISIDTDIVRGVAGVYPYDNSGTPRNHAAGSVVVFSNSPSVYESILAYVEDVAVSGSPNATTTSKGIVQTATQAQINADTGVGSTGADLFVRPDLLALSKYGLQLPTANQKAAFVGTSGTAPTGANPFVDAADVSSAGASGKIVRLNGTAYPPGDASGLTNLTGVGTVGSLILAAVNIAAVKPVRVGPYQSDGGVLVDTSGQMATTSASSLSGSVAIGANANRTLVVFVGNTAQNITSVTFAGIAMTQVDTQLLFGSGSNWRGKSYILVAPATGSGSLVVTFSGTATTAGLTYYSLYNTSQTGAPEGHTSDINSASPLTLATIANGAMVLSACVNAGLSSTNTGSATYENHVTSTGGVESWDSSIVYPAGTTVSLSKTSSAIASFMISIAPFTAVTYQLQLASSAAPTNQYINLYEGIVGFTFASVLAAANATVIHAGRLTGFSGLQPGREYYLNDTPGAIGLTAGTNSKKVGTAISATDMLVRI